MLHMQIEPSCWSIVMSCVSSVRVLVPIGDVGHAELDGRVGLVDLPAFIFFCSLALHRGTHGF